MTFDEYESEDIDYLCDLEAEAEVYELYRDYLGEVRKNNPGESNEVWEEMAREMAREAYADSLSPEWKVRY